MLNQKPMNLGGSRHAQRRAQSSFDLTDFPVFRHQSDGQQFGVGSGFSSHFVGETTKLKGVG